MIFFPIICASLFAPLPRIISAAPAYTYQKPVVIDNNPSVGRTAEISPPVSRSFEISPPVSRSFEISPLHHNEEIAWNEGETKSKDEESGNYEDNWEPIVLELGPTNPGIIMDRCIGDDCECPPGMVGVEPFCREPGKDEGSNYDINSGINYAGGDEYINNPSIGETESEDKGSNYDKNSGININININNPTSGKDEGSNYDINSGINYAGGDKYINNPSIGVPDTGCPTICTNDYTPVCDSNGITHSNKCAFEIAACEAKKMNINLVMVSDGPCGE